MRCIPHGRRGPAQSKSNCDEHAGSDNVLRIQPYSLTNYCKEVNLQRKE